jgi:predicted ATPase
MPFLRSVQLGDEPRDDAAHPFSVPAIAQLGRLDIGADVTFFVGPNGSGKSTLLEALAVHQGMNAEGGTQNMSFSTFDRSVSELHEHLVVGRSGAPRTRFFLRAESFFNVATAIEDYDVARSYGGSLHERSHGESFLDLIEHRFTAQGLYLLDEPEAALSIHGILRLIASIHDLVALGSQFIIATHSPVLMAFPDAVIYEFDRNGVGRVEWEDVDTVTLTRAFLEQPRRFLDELCTDPPSDATG